MNFPFTNSFIVALGVIKDAAAKANKNLGLLESTKQRAISRAAKEVRLNKHDALNFPSMFFKRVQVLAPT